jgi:hypothetical protein
MPIPALHPGVGRAGDPLGPFADVAESRELRLLVDLPAKQRQMDDCITTWDRLGVPNPSRLLWTLAQREDITLFWMADLEDGEDKGAVRFHEPNRDRDQLEFTTEEANGSYVQAVWPYRQWEDLAVPSVPSGTTGARWLRDVLVAQVARELRVDVLVTDSRSLLDSTYGWVKHANPMTAEQALAVIGLYLRRRRQYPMAVAGPGRLTFGEHLLLWTAARAQLPSSWRWGSALVTHSYAVNRDSPKFLFQSLHERVVRLLRCRDGVHAALLAKQDNQTAGEATEAFDYFMVNLVGAFDASARAAHLAVGLDAGKRRSAAWQNDAWRRDVRKTDPELADLFAPGSTHARVFEVCRMLRNTVHGEALHSTAVQGSGGLRHTLVALPEDDAHDLAALFDQLGGREEWGLHQLAFSRLHVDPARLIERLLPQALQMLDDALRLTPVERLDGVIASKLTTAPPDDLSFGLGTRVRASLLFGLPVPSK